jgi:alkanesulfonate monooxygenase SsuD/methylene tetrahydromethanopterin reductase-like flavin-dependent oxidoreductase (luciferase family)
MIAGSFSLMTDRRMPALSLAATSGKRAGVISAAVEAERIGFTGVHCPSFGDALGLCLSVAHATTTLKMATSIQPIYFQLPSQLASQAAHLHEMSGGRFQLGIGVSHDAVLDNMKVERSTPLADMRAYVEAMHATSKSVGPLPPIVLATLRNKMLDLSVELADGAVWANAARTAMPAQLATIPANRLADGFFVGNMLPTVIDDDRDAAAAVCRKTLTMYVQLPNYRNYWKAAGYEEEMTAIEEALGRRDREAIPGLMSERWLKEVTLFGSADEVRDGVEAWFDAGVSTPILVPSSTTGGQAKALAEVFSLFA